MNLRWIGIPLLLSAAAAQTPRPSDWLSAGGDSRHTGWEKSDSQISRSTVKDFKVVLRHKLGAGESLNAPLIVGRLISFKGFKELAIVTGASGHVWALDADLDRIFWERQLPSGKGACGRVAMPAMMPAPDAGPARNTPRAIFIVAGDGKLYSLNPATGEDLAPPLNFLPPGANAASFAVAENVVYTSTDGTCGAPKADWSIEVATGTVSHKSLNPAWQSSTWLDGATNLPWVVEARQKPKGAIVASQGSKQMWESHAMEAPDIPVIAGGVVFALASDGAAGNAVLYGLDALTGEQIFSTGSQIASPKTGTGLAVANGRVYFTTKDGTLWAFGSPMDRD